MKEKIIVFGLGKDFRRYREKIQETFDVVGCTDNHIVPEEIFWRECYVKPEDITRYHFDKVLICSRKYRDSIKTQLAKSMIPAGKIIDIESIGTSESQSSLEEVIHDMETYQSLNTDEKFPIVEDSLWLIGTDKHAEAGNPSAHYFAQDIWGASKVFFNNPKKHYDIGSRLDGFIAHLLIFREVEYIDVRPLPYEIPNLHFVCGDATSLTCLGSESIESLSCLHAMEHFGLGRYGDKVDPDAYKKAAESMQRVLKPGGHLYLGVPIGPEDKLVFNAHRIFSVETILSLFGKMQLRELAVIEPEGVHAKVIEVENGRGIMEYSCGLFEFVK